MPAFNRRLRISQVLSIWRRRRFSIGLPFSWEHCRITATYEAGFSTLSDVANGSHVLLQSESTRRLNSHVSLPGDGVFSITSRGTSFKRQLSISSTCRKRKASSRKPHEHLANTWELREVDIPIGGSGNVRLDIHTLTQRPGTGNTMSKHAQDQVLESDVVKTIDHNDQIHSHTAEKRNVILVYFPPGPVPHNYSSFSMRMFDEFLDALIVILNDDPTAGSICPTVIKLNYRLGEVSFVDEQSHALRFPSPIHAASVSFDWIVEHKEAIIKTSRVLNSDDVSTALQEPEIYSLGSHIGGALALTLGLTMPNEIEAIVAIDPVVDWTGFDEIASGLETDEPSEDLENEPYLQMGMQFDKQLKKKRRSSRSTARIRLDKLQKIHAAKAMINLRNSLFHSPSGYFDQFASPLLFLRAPGKDTPVWKTAKEPDSEGGSVEAFGPYDDDWQATHHNRDDQVVISGAQDAFDQSQMDNIAEAVGTDIAHSSNPDRVLDSHISSTEDAIEMFGDKQIGTDLSETGISTSALEDDNTQSRQAVSDLSKPDLPTPPPSISLNKLSRSDKDIPKPVKRRKTVKRWPAVGRPEEVLLPYVGIFATPPSSISDDPVSDDSSTTDVSSVLYPQAKEMAELMRRACFWGREKSLAEERVVFEEVAESHPKNNKDFEQSRLDQSISQVNSSVCRWLVDHIKRD